MTRTIPGTIEDEGREFLYVEVDSDEEFRQLLNDALASNTDVPMPQSGGAIEEKARISLGSDSALMAMSYKGDVLGWRRKLAAYCETKGRKWGVATGQSLTLSDGSQIDLVDGNVIFED